ncbi:peroxisome proliferator-activated receptor gamma coactivator 1-beta isoform X2 [Dendropsophus ebraccatus]|uniref:peroxisome proliferator-activated receptor gamma coactivator 1-beta isoform X2 n=1 Tax=Dendropsophus ebraccatus TaxID=150705 RepID=UPI003831FC09
MADCSTLLDEALESFVFSYLTDSPEPGEESLSLDFPEIDLSQLDAGDFDTNSCFNELQWCNDQSENESSQYSTDDSELFQIDGENEALLAALTQTLDDIQEDDINLSAFISSGDGDIYPAPAFSPKPSRPTEFPKSLETEDELSILKKLLLSPAQTPTGSDAHNESSSRHQGTSKVRLQRQSLKVESPQERPTGIPQAQGRSCSELHRHLVSTTHVTQHAAKDESNEEEHDSVEEVHSDDDSGSSSPLYSLQGQEPQFTCEKEKHAVVELIRYMHTYCLPLKKHHSDEKYQQSSSLLKRTKSDSMQPKYTCGNKMNLANVKGNCLALGMLKRTKRTWSGSSILKELLARDICEDVSKPYRLAQPVYAAFSHLSCRRLPQDKVEGGLGKGIKPAMEKTEKPYLALRKEGRCMGADAAQEQVTNKSASKQECSVYVRRSSRLNPEFWFNDETSLQPCIARTDGDSQPPAAQNLCLTVEPFVDEEQVAEIEVEETNETNGQTEDRALQDLDGLESDAPEAHTNITNQQYHPQDNTRCSSLSLTEPTSAFEKRTFEEGLTVELCGTAGLTPPTTPPYKPAEEDLYKPEISQESVNKGSPITLSLKGEAADVHLSVNRKLVKKQPERTELYAHLSRSESLPASSPSLGIKRPFSRSFGDHDYCQVKKSETVFQRKILKPLDLPNYGDKKKKQPVPLMPQRKVTEGSLTQDTKVLKDHEIRASLTKHFGFPDNPLKEEEDDVTCINPEYDSVFEDSDSDCSSPDEACLSPLRTKSCSRRSPQSKLQSYRQGRTTARIISSTDSKRTHRCESNEQRQTGNMSQRQIQRRRQKAIDEGRLICIRSLSASVSANELKRRFEVFGEITECLILSRSRGDKYGLITYRFHEDAALSLKKGPSLRKRNEPLFHMSYGGLRHFFWTKYTDLDSNAAEPSAAVMKSKYESMDFDSLLKEAQRSLHR